MAPITPSQFAEIPCRFKDSYQWLSTTTLLVLLLFLSLLLSCNSSMDPEPPEEEVIDPGNETVDLVGAELNYRNHCGGCHGQNLSSFVEREWTYGNSFEEVMQSITDGYTNNGMPAYGATFSEQEIQELTQLDDTGRSWFSAHRVLPHSQGE